MIGLIARIGLLSLVVLPSTADGNGGTLRLSQAPAGPYLVSAWTRPDPPRVGRLDVSVAVMTRERGGGGNLLLYHGNLELPAAGTWRVLVQPGGPVGSSGSAAFELDVRSPPSIVGAIAIGLLVALGIGGWLWWAQTRRATTPS